MLDRRGLGLETASGTESSARPTAIEALLEDARRYFELESGDGRPSLSEKFRIVLHARGLHAIAVHRFGRWAHHGVRNRALRAALKVSYAVLHRITPACRFCHIHVGAEIGPGFYIGHEMGVMIGPSVIGRGCSVAHNVTIGRRADGVGKTPTIGDGVWIGTGSVLFGPIHVGEGATISPLTVVGRNVAPHCLAAGNPLRVVRNAYDNLAQVHGKNRGASAPEPDDQA